MSVVRRFAHLWQLLVFYSLIISSVVLSLKAMSKVVRVAEPVWRKAAENHRARIRELLLPGLTRPPTHKQKGRKIGLVDNDDWTALDSKNPVFNFLIEYYGIKGRKGPRRLARWSTDPSLLVENNCIDGGILLEGASEKDLGGTLHLRGAIMHGDGVVYSPAEFFGKNDPHRRAENARAVTPFLWYQSVLKQTLAAEPVLHCHGLHEWAMQYHPRGEEKPPSAKYQDHLPLRVSPHIINETVERKGVSCTHVDALRFFAPAALPLNHYGGKLERLDQLRLEQPACVHAIMDNLKMAQRLLPFCDAELIERVLQISLKARRLDVAASPYDASEYGVGVVPVETPQGRSLYRKEQAALMQECLPIRKELLRAYEIFLMIAFNNESLDAVVDSSSMPEQFPNAEPTGSPRGRKTLTVP